MVVLGSWPYTHTLTLDRLARDLGATCYYFVDENRIIQGSEADTLEQRGYIVDEEYYTVMSESIHMDVMAVRAQSFPPTMPPHIADMINSSENPKFTASHNRVKSSALVYVNGQDRALMEDIGASYNQSLNVWVVDGVALKLLREKRRSATGGKIVCKPYLDSKIQINGDVSSHIDLLKSVGAKYDEQTDAWYVDIAVIDKIQHIITK